MKTLLAFTITLLFPLLLAVQAGATIISVSGDLSSLGAAAEIIAAPASVIDDPPGATNLGQQGFDEAQNVTLLAAITTDQGIIAAGTVVNSQMIFFNTDGGATVSHNNVEWTFDGVILGTMSDRDGLLEAASNAELGALGTDYPGDFLFRGLDGPLDSLVISGDTLMASIDMTVSEPGDWIRVVTAATPVPEPGTMLLLGSGLFGLAAWRRLKKNA